LLSIVSASLALFTLSLHAALPILLALGLARLRLLRAFRGLLGRRLGLLLRLGPLSVRPWLLGLVRLSVALPGLGLSVVGSVVLRSEEHTSELQSRENLVCRLLLEK